MVCCHVWPFDKLLMSGRSLAAVVIDLRTIARRPEEGYHTTYRMLELKHHHEMHPK